IFLWRLSGKRGAEYCYSSDGKRSSLTSLTKKNIRKRAGANVPGETVGFRLPYISTRTGNVLLTCTACAYLRWDLGVAVRNRGNVFPQRFAAPCAGGEGVCRIDAHPWAPSRRTLLL